MSYKCSVFDCKNRYSTSKIGDTTKNKAVSFFEFPPSPTRKRNWLENIGRPYYTPPKSARICSQHFNEKDLARKDNNFILYKDTVPLAVHPENKISTRRLTFNSSRISEENVAKNNNKRTHPSSITSSPKETQKRPRNSVLIGSYDFGVKNTSTTNTTSLVPENTIKRRRNTVFVGTYNFGVRKNAVSKSKPSQPVLKKMSTVSNNQLSIKNFLIKKIASPTQEDDTNPTVSCREDCMFGWTEMGSRDIPYIPFIPYIVRGSENYCALRMIEITALANNEKKKPIIDSLKTNVESYDPTKVQCRLLNEINEQHCNSTFGRVPFTTKDKLIRLSDASKYFKFLEVCHNAQLKGVKKSTEGLEFGFTLCLLAYRFKQENLILPVVAEYKLPRVVPQIRF